MTATDSARAFGRQSARKRVLRRLLGDACWRQPVSAREGAHRGRGDRTEFAVDVADGKTQLRETGLQLPHPLADRSHGQGTVIDLGCKIYLAQLFNNRFLGRQVEPAAAEREC
jgi:hypothetical protein